MLRNIKASLYFPIAYYFRFFAAIKLRRWNPKIIIITGSSGKTTLLHIVESQIGKQAKYSYHANSAYGIPFDILGLKRDKLVLSEWLYLFLVAPFRAFGKPAKEEIYIVEADCDRPGEGKFLASLLQPVVTLWISSSRTHSMNFDRVVDGKKFLNVDEAIAYEFGYFLEYTSGLALLNGDDEVMVKQQGRTTAKSKLIKEEQLKKWTITSDTTIFDIDQKNYVFPALLPEETFYSLAMTIELLQYLHIQSDLTFEKFTLPPGRSSLFKGIKNTFLIDSSYNASLSSMKAILHMFAVYPAEKKWLVIGDMIEQGKEEQEEHEKLAEIIATLNVSNIILMGTRVTKYTYPKLKKLMNNKTSVISFDNPAEAFDYLLQSMQGKEVILFKGARFMEGIIEKLLADKNDSEKLCRREKIWQLRREQWGL